MMPRLSSLAQAVAFTALASCSSSNEAPGRKSPVVEAGRKTTGKKALEVAKTEVEDKKNDGATEGEVEVLKIAEPDKIQALTKAMQEGARGCVEAIEDGDKKKVEIPDPFDPNPESAKKVKATRYVLKKTVRGKKIEKECFAERTGDGGTLKKIRVNKKPIFARAFSYRETTNGAVTAQVHASFLQQGIPFSSEPDAKPGSEGQLASVFQAETLGGNEMHVIHRESSGPCGKSESLGVVAEFAGEAVNACPEESKPLEKADVAFVEKLRAAVERVTDAIE